MRVLWGLNGITVGLQVNAEDFNLLRHKSYLQHVKIQFIPHRNRLFLQNKDHLFNVAFWIDDILRITWNTLCGQNAVFWRSRKAVAKGDYLSRHACTSCPSVCPSVRVEQRNSHRTGFRELPYSGFLLKFVTYWFWLQLYKNVKLFTWRSKYTRDWLWFTLWATSHAGKPGSNRRSSSLVVINNCGQAVSRRSRTAEAQIRSSTSPCEMWWKKVVPGHVFSGDLGFPVLCIILPIFQSNAPSDIGKQWKEKQPLPNKNKVWSIVNLTVYEINKKYDVSHISIIIDCTYIAKKRSVCV